MRLAIFNGLASPLAKPSSSQEDQEVIFACLAPLRDKSCSDRSVEGSRQGAKYAKKDKAKLFKILLLCETNLLIAPEAGYTAASPFMAFMMISKPEGRKAVPSV